MPIVSFPLGRRRFAPSWPMTLLTVALCLVFVRLGNWQWERGVHRQAEWDAFARRCRCAGPPRRIVGGVVARFQRIVVAGSWDAAHQFLLDNRSHGGLPGYEVLTPLRLADGRLLLVDRGWVAFTGSRARLPDITLDGREPVSVTGRLDNPPVGGLALGRAAARRRCLAQGHQLPHAGRAGRHPRESGRTVDTAAGSGQWQWLRQGLAAPGSTTAAASFLCHPMVGFRRDAPDHLGDHERPATGAETAFMSSVIDPELHRRNFRTVLALAGLFLLPLLLSFWLYYGVHWHPQAMSNHGELISRCGHCPTCRSPIWRAPSKATCSRATGRWCMSATARAMRIADNVLFFMRQTRLSLNNEMTRVQRVFLATADCCDRAFLACPSIPGCACSTPRRPRPNRFCAVSSRWAGAGAVRRGSLGKPHDALRCATATAGPARGPQAAAAAISHWLN